MKAMKAMTRSGMSGLHPDILNSEPRTEVSSAGSPARPAHVAASPSGRIALPLLSVGSRMPRGRSGGGQAVEPVGAGVGEQRLYGRPRGGPPRGPEAEPVQPNLAEDREDGLASPGGWPGSDCDLGTAWGSATQKTRSP